MTTLNAAAPSSRNTGIQPVPWRLLAWVSWRQYRLSAAGTAAFLGVLAEGGWVLARSLLLIAATVWLVRRRAA
jgi:hypothetical protein